ncbi:hypothetical protein L083_3467 [Actinoplanes sp. N902-109]|nr:hypothetical protein L083_3467 [Actinoplanes sp. N902-109]
MIAMALVLILSVLLVAACGYALWPRREAGPSGAPGPAGAARPGTPGSDPPGVARAEPETLEGALVGQLLARGITPAGYRHAMAELAARDAERHPLSVPPTEPT